MTGLVTWVEDLDEVKPFPVTFVSERMRRSLSGLVTS